MKWTPALVALHLSLASTMASANQEVHDYLMACREAKAVSSPAPQIPRALTRRPIAWVLRWEWLTR